MDAPAEETRELAEEFEVSTAVMGEFLDRFSPDRAKKDQFQSDADVMLFVHIPKTAGMSVGKSLQAAFRHFRGVDWKNVAPSFRHNMRQALYTQTREKSRQVIIGHYGWPELQIWKSHELPMKCGTVFRDPLARAISNYNYNLSDAHPDHESFRERFPTALSFLQAVPIDAQLSQAIGFIDSFETALRKFNTHYTFLGVTELLGQSLAHLGRTHGLPNLQEHRENVGKVRPDPEVPDELVERVNQRSHNDGKMHRLLLRMYRGRSTAMLRGPGGNECLSDG